MENLQEPGFERTILKLHRQFDKDEIVGLLRKEVSRLEFNQGVLKSGIAELEYLLKKEREQPKMVTNELLEEYPDKAKMIQKFNSKITELEKQICHMKKTNGELITKIVKYEAERISFIS